ncbi:MAG: hypothetical protein ACN4GW_17150 [Desulforhopalus sp.]
MQSCSRKFYLFLTFHCFLLGLFPFFLPVFLFKQGGDLATISWFIAITGLGFVVTLYLFDHTRAKSATLPIVCSFLLEGGLLALLLGDAPMPVIALVNGGYSCLYWTIQRVLFFANGSSEDSGRRFGNFQIYVFIVLKVGVFFGSLLLENVGIWAIALLSLLVGGIGIRLLTGDVAGLDFPLVMQQQKVLTFSDITRFRDNCNSRLVFMLDGIFLYLESYFWLITLFLVVGENFFRLGLLVIVLAVGLSIIFYLLKNGIDRMDGNRLYMSAVVFYIASWALRASFDSELNYSLQISMLLVISFCTSFFRLAFNKRFFDIAEKSFHYHYLFMKSYYSQLFLVLGFGFAGVCFFATEIGMGAMLKGSYWVGAIIAGLYFCYRPAEISLKEMID